jgi:hypothetical protein
MPPPVRWSMPPNDASVWRVTNYMGASLSSFADLFGTHGYRLVACNPVTGVNAFFVREEFADRFADVPADINELYASPYYQFQRHGHAADPRVARRALEIGAQVNAGKKRPEYVTSATLGSN